MKVVTTTKKKKFTDRRTAAITVRMLRAELDVLLAVKGAMRERDPIHERPTTRGMAAVVVQSSVRDLP